VAYSNTFDRRAIWVFGLFFALLLLGFILALLWLQGGSAAPPGSPYRALEHRLPQLTADDRSQLLDIVEQAIGDSSDSFVPPARFANMHHRGFVLLWQNGRKRHAWWSDSDNLAASVYHTTRALVEKAPLASTHDLLLHLQIMGRDRPLADGGYIHGLHGLSLRRHQVINSYGSYAVETNFRPARLLERLQRKLDEIDDSDGATAGFYFPVDHFGRRHGSDDLVVFYKGSTPKLALSLTLDEFQSARARAQRWLTGALRADGQFHYLYYPSRDEYPAGKNNVLRQLMASRALAEMAARDPQWLDAHRRNLTCLFDRWYREEGELGYILYRDKSKLGAIAMALRTLVYSPLFDSYRKEAGKLVNAILHLQAADGAFRPWFIAPDYPYDEERLLTFYSGEALLALAEYAQKTGNSAVLKAATRSQAFYIRRYVDEIERHYYPAYVPWHTQSLRKLHEMTGERRYARAIFTMTDRLLEIQNQDGAGDRYYLGRFFNPATPQYGSPHASSDAVYTEGLAHAFEVAVLLEDKERAERYGHALKLGLHNLLNLQYRDERLYFLRRPQAVDGALRIHTTDNKVRVDTTQHALDAFDKVQALLERGILTF
jgi:hypothetical protein